MHLPKYTLVWSVCSIDPSLPYLPSLCVRTVFVYSSEILATAAHFIAAAIVICGGSVVVWHVQGMHFLSYYACRKIIIKVCKNVSTLHGIISSF